MNLPVNQLINSEEIYWKLLAKEPREMETRNNAGHYHRIIKLMKWTTAGERKTREVGKYLKTRFQFFHLFNVNKEFLKKVGV
jgi:hypothetical protein